METNSPNFGQPAGPTATGGGAAALAAAPLFHAAWLFAVGIVAAQWIYLRPSLVLVAALAMAVVCGLAALAARRVVALPLALLWCLLGAWCAQVEPHPAPAPQLAALSDGLLRTVEGTVVETAPLRSDMEQSLDEPVSGHPSQRIDLDVASMEVVTDAGDQQEPANGRARLTVRWPIGAAGMQVFQCGERVRVVARLLPPETYHDPGVWSRGEFLLEQGVTASATVNAERVERLGQAPGAFAACRLDGLQHASSARLLALPAAMRRLPAALRLSQDDAVMLAAMVTGDRTFLTHSLRVGFERTGSFHMLVVSGFHLAIVAGCIFWAARRLRLSRIPATLATIAASFAYALFTGFATPVQRSLWMVVLYLVGRLIYRERNVLNTIGFAALCLLAASPRSLFEASLQMTLLAVVVIGGVAAPLLQGTIHPYISALGDLRLQSVDLKLEPRVAQFRVTLRLVAEHLHAALGERFGAWTAWRGFPWLVRASLRAAEWVVVSCVVELAMAAPMAIYFHRITVFALPVNVFILPLLLMLMPVALVTLLALAVWPAVAVAPASLAAVLLHLGSGMVRFFGSTALGDFRIPAPTLRQSAGFCLLLAAVLVLARLGSPPPMRWARRAAWIALVAAALVVVAPRAVEHPRDALLVEAIDVGQGDSLLVVSPDGKTLLVDGGGFGGGPRQSPQEFDIGEEVVSEALWARGIRRLDAVALTHAHSDHMGGLPAVVRNFHPAELWVGNNPATASYTALLNEAAALGVKLRKLHEGESLDLGAARVRVLAPQADYEPGVEPGNNDSLVLQVAYGSTAALLEGDAETPVEDALLGEPGLGSTLFKVGHHGSISSTGPAFLARVAPNWAVISCGPRNRYGHPRFEILEELQAARVRTFRTDVNGISCFRLDGKAAVPDDSCLAWKQR